MAATALDLLPFETWPSQIDQASDPANNNALRAEVIARPAISFISSLPGSPSEGDLHVLDVDIGDEVAGTLAFYTSGAWTYWNPVEGMLKRIGTDYYTFDPDSSAEWQPYGAGQVIVPIGIALADETTDITTGTAKATFRMPFPMTLTDVRIGMTGAPTGSAAQFDVNVTGVGSILSTPITVDAGEKTSTTAATPPVISTSNLADDAEVTVDFDQVGSTSPGKGPKLWLIGFKTP